MTIERHAIAKVFREESGRIRATLIRVLRDFDLADDALQDAFASALAHWPADGIPDQPAAWIMTAARRKAIDRIRKKKRGRLVGVELDQCDSSDPAGIEELEALMDCTVADDRLRLIFTCCHPAIHREAQVGLTLHTLGGLTTPEIARAFLVSKTTLAQRLVRAKKKIKEANIPYEVPPDHALPERVPSVLSVLYLIFNEGYSATSGDSLLRRALCNEAIRLARILTSLMPDEPEALGLLSLFLFQHARSAARMTRDAELILLEDQNRTLWDENAIADGRANLDGAMQLRRPGSYQIQAAIAGLHSMAPSFGETDWGQILGLYDALMRFHPSPVVALNRAAVVAMISGPESGLRAVDEIGVGELEEYQFYHSTRADLLRRMNRLNEAESAYRRALELAGNESERSYLKKRISQCTDSKA